MAKITIIVGVLLALVGVGAYSFSTSDKPETALIPAYIGAGFVVLGALLIPNVKILRIIIAHLLLVAALLLPIPIFIRWAGGNFSTGLAIAAQVATIVLLWGYVVIGVRSFIAARRERKALAA